MAEQLKTRDFFLAGEAVAYLTSAAIRLRFLPFFRVTRTLRTLQSPGRDDRRLTPEEQVKVCSIAVTLRQNSPLFPAQLTCFAKATAFSRVCQSGPDLLKHSGKLTRPKDTS